MAKFEDIVKSHPIVLVDFHATWCGPCKALAPILKDLKNKMKDQIKIVKIDVDKHQVLSGQLGVRGVPTMILYKDGKQVWRQSGVVPLHSLVQVIGGYL
ncbi:thioredoxin [Paracrocinitomix mangrovi]|uniref:thioredoxin n=1 Tax=Paracrocinitomix mangrovi TaxID=2862509 RepID=UPI001C8EB8A6|nr:thioredoxin [Paracrocinitomix mangrovi]UKN01177.1 thioredoxin [Paracrocinitomix mangrovi]